MTSTKRAISRAYRQLGDIDRKHESGKYTKRQHDAKSKKVLKELVRRVRNK